MKLAIVPVFLLLVTTASPQSVNLPSSKKLTLPAPGAPQPTDSFPVSVALTPDGRYLAILDNGYGRFEHNQRQGIGVLDLQSNKLAFFPDERLGRKDHQTYFLGLAFSSDGSRLYASIGSLTDPLAKRRGSLGNGIAVYRFEGGRVMPERFIPLAPVALPPSKRRAAALEAAPQGTAPPFPAGIAVIRSAQGDQLLVAENLSDSAVLLDAASGRIIHRFDLSTNANIPASYPYAVVVNRAGTRAWCSLWNASRVAELDLQSGKVVRMIALRQPKSATATGSHPNAMLLNERDDSLYVALANADEVAVIRTTDGTVARYLSTRMPAQKSLGSVPNALAQTANGERLFVANASSDSVAVFDTSPRRASRPENSLGFIPTEWYPTALAVHGNDLFIATGKSQGTGRNNMPSPATDGRPERTYIGNLLHGSVARVNISEAERNLAALTRQVEDDNLMSGRTGDIVFHDGSRCGPPVRVATRDFEKSAPQSNCKIKHVLYIIKENRTYDQVFGDLGVGDGDPSLTMYGEPITPNQHALARQFGVLDNFYDSGEVSGDGHVWSTAAITSDYNEKTWQLNYRGKERTYDFEGRVMYETPLEQGIPDIDEPGTGYLWANAARHGLTLRDYGEFIATAFCDEARMDGLPSEWGPPLPPGVKCPRATINKGEPVPANVGDPRGGPSPYPWPIPMIGVSFATKPELRDHFDPLYPMFRVEYPDQFRADEFLNEFQKFERDRRSGKDTLPNLIIMHLPNDHTEGTKPGKPRPAASLADNDLAVGRIVEAISNSPYWDDTAILILEDDAQDGSDHVDAHRSTALVISKYAPHPSGSSGAFVDHHFYTTVNMVHTIESLLGLPPMNNNDAQAAVMAPLFSGPGDQPPFKADYRNRDNGMLYQMNPGNAPGAKMSSKMDFSRPDAVDTVVLNRTLWRDAMGKRPMPKPRHSVIPVREAKQDDD